MRYGLSRAVVVVVVGAVALPASAQAAPATFAGDCTFSGQVQHAATTVNSTSGECTGTLVRADGVSLGPSTVFPARLTASQTSSLSGSCNFGSLTTTPGSASVKFLGVYPPPPGSTTAGNEIIDTAIDALVWGRDQMAFALSGGPSPDHPLGTHATMMLTRGDTGCNSPISQSFTGTLETGPSPTSGDAAGNVLIDR